MKVKVVLVVVAVVLAVAWCVPVLGLMGCGSAPRREPPDVWVPLKDRQDGEVALKHDLVTQVHYTTPFAERPTLEFGTHTNAVQIIEQRADGFAVTLHPDWPEPYSVSWTAKEKLVGAK